jgi:outer membrane receptor protein involved in Fe transport
VLKDLPAVRRLELELGCRYSMYDSGAGDVPTWKALMTWSPVDWINVRGAYQKANRAPNIAELYLGETTIVSFGASDPCRTNNLVQEAWHNNARNPNRAQLQALCSALIANAASDFHVNPNGFTGWGGGLQIQLGNPGLKSESGETWTLGTVFRSPFDHPLARGLSASVDYYKAEIWDNIGALTVQEVLDAVSDPLENVGFSNLPKWRATTRFSYFVRSFSARINWRYQPGAKPGAAQTNPDTLTIGGSSYSRFDGNAGYRIGQLDLRLSISNLLNTAPPPYGYSPWTTGASTNLAAADIVGRRYTVTASMNF